MRARQTDGGGRRACTRACHRAVPSGDHVLQMNTSVAAAWSLEKHEAAVYVLVCLLMALGCVFVCVGRWNEVARSLTCVEMSALFQTAGPLWLQLDCRKNKSHFSSQWVKLNRKQRQCVCLIFRTPTNSPIDLCMVLKYTSAGKGLLLCDEQTLIFKYFGKNVDLSST